MDPSRQYQRTHPTSLASGYIPSPGIHPTDYTMASQYQQQQPSTPQHPQPPASTITKPSMVPEHSQSIGVVQVRTVFMTEDRQLKAIQLAKEACLNEKMQTSPRDIAGHIKMGFDALYGPCWHCIVGRSFGSFVTHEKDNFIFFYVDQWAIMLFKTA